MLYYILYSLHESYSVFNVFKYITFRTAYAVLTAFLISLFMGPWVIRKLKEYQIGENIREDGPRSHITKTGTPTMGGILIIISLFIPTILWADIKNIYILLIIFSTIGFGLIGFADDYLKVARKRSLGLGAKEKFVVQISIALCIAIVLIYLIPERASYATKLGIPFFKEVRPDIGLFYIPFVMLVVVGASNAVNLTDGLDGLAIGPIIIATAAYTAIIYVSGHYNFANYLDIQYVKGAGEVTIFCGAILGASLGFLWFNTYPAQIFMGNVGSLALGGALGTIAVISKHELILILIGGLFVIEALSVIMQVVYFKLSKGRRIFRMAPLHHHFEEKGWEEPKVIVRFWIIALVLALLALSTLKLR
ncbi:MAG: phospho-N-acetylmuramoyl-pentapeptide-transferase [Nitrospinae bacterium]|nr:phospho-N-acetylmuramoyl-pentapeptide-transferase [Nitrospinota bacterium]